MANIYQGYIGIAKIGSSQIRCTAFNVNPQQEILWYDHIVGLRDQLATGLDTKGIIDESDNPNVLQKTFFRPGVQIVQGTMDFPLTDRISDHVFELAKTAKNFTLDFDYYCDASRRFLNCRVNSYTFSITAGDIATVSLDIMGTGMVETTSSRLVGDYDEPEKLVTWDAVDIDVSSGDTGEQWDKLSSFDMTINNNVRPIYTSGANRANEKNLFPLELRVGMQHVTGTLVKYNKEYITKSVYGTVDIDVSYPDGVAFDMRTVFKPMTAEGRTGPILSAYGYECVDKHFY